MSAKTCQVTFLPDQKTVSAVLGETILEVALNHGIPLHHACGGYCACTTCQVSIKAGVENASVMEEEEQERLERADDHVAGGRLGCQTKVMGDLTIERVHTD